MAELLRADNGLWKEEAKGIREFYAKFGDRLPGELIEELNGLESRL